MENIMKREQQLMEHIAKQDQQILEMSEKVGNIKSGPNITNNIMNVNIFLSDYCKDAIDIETFLASLSVNTDDINKLTSGNIQTGVKDVFTRAIGKLSITERPFQCVDVKRKTMYVNHKEAGWKKDPNNEISLRMVDYIIDNYKKTIPEWTDENPDFTTNSHPTQDIFKALVNIIYKARTPHLDNQMMKFISNKTACTKDIITREIENRINTY